MPGASLDRTKQSGSLFSQKLDRVAFITYFLGAVVPLLGLTVVVDRFALPTADRIAAISLIAAVTSIAVLSLGAFLVLRNMTLRSLAQRDRDNLRLASLLRLSSRLASAQHLTEATGTIAQRAADMTGSSHAFILLRGDDAEKAPTLAETAGEDTDRLYATIEEPLGAMVSLVLEHGRPALRGPGDGSPAFSAVVVPLPGDPAPLGALAVVRTGTADAFESDDVDGLSTLAALSAVALHNADLRDAQRNFFSHVTEIIVTALDAHLGYNTGHGNRVAQYANRLGRALELDDDRLQRLHFAALLHDIGMLKLDRNHQLSPKTAGKHTTIGYRMLARIRLWKDIAPIVHHHHEWWDGSGYPDGISEREIPLEARIIALCDAFDTMSNEASYKEAMPQRECVAELERGAGTQFDPELVSVFVGLIEQGVVSVESH